MNATPPDPARRRPLSLRRTLLLGILGPILLFVLIDTVSLYRQTLAVVTQAYDRTLLASAKSIGELVTVRGYDDEARLSADLPYAALEAFEADNESRLFYRVADTAGRTISGFPAFPPWSGRIPDRPAYAALVDFYDDRYQDTDVRVAVLLQPVTSEHGRGMAVIQVAETLELRHAAARRVLRETLLRQAVLVAVISLAVVLVVQAAVRPVRRLSAQLRDRPDGDLTPLPLAGAPRELLPLLEATNAVMTRLARLLDNQQRFVRDASHQLRTPLAVLKVQVQSARRGDLPATDALAEIGATVDRATELANQMLALAKVEQLRESTHTAVTDWEPIVRALALELSPLIGQHNLDFELDTRPTPVQAHEWMLRELARNLLANAIRHSPAGAPLSVSLRPDAGSAVLTVRDAGPGIAPELRERLFQPFASGNPANGSGLGLLICQQIAQALGGAITLVNRIDDGRVAGLSASARLPLSPAPAARDHDADDSVIGGTARAIQPPTQTPDPVPRGQSGPQSTA